MLSTVSWRRFVAIALATAAAAGLLIALASPGHSRSVLLGFNEDPGSYALQASVGAPIRRMQIGWNLAEPSPGAWDWARFDSEYRAIVAGHLRPLLLVGSTPCWAHPSVACNGPYDAIAPADPAYLEQWGDFVKRVAERYPAAVGIEIWNEENLAFQFGPRPDARRYAQLLRTAFRAVKSARESMPVIVGGLFSSASSGPTGIADSEYLAELYDYGAKGFMDGIGVHPYPSSGGWTGTPPGGDREVVKQALARLLRVRAAAHDGRTGLWITEVGEPTGLSEEPQATGLVGLVKMLRSDPLVRMVLVHRLIDRPGSGGYGVFRGDGTPKAAACRLARVLGGNLPCGQARAPHP